MSVGVLLLLLWFYYSSSVATKIFQKFVGNWLLMIAIALLLLGSCGLASAWLWNPCCLCAFAWLALLLGATCGSAGSVLLVQPGSDPARLERVCEQAGSVKTLAQLKAPASVVTAQSSYDSMREALAWCRRKNKLAIRLSACPNAVDSANQTWRTNPYRTLFSWAENKFACGGFCQDGAPLFGLPPGTVNEDNRARPRPACFAPIAAELRRQVLVAAGALVLAGILLLGPALCACWLACAPPPVRRADYVHHPKELEWTAVAQEDSDSEY